MGYFLPILRNATYYLFKGLIKKLIRSPKTPIAQTVKKISNQNHFGKCIKQGKQKKLDFSITVGKRNK